VDIFMLVFQQLLKIDPMSLAKYTNVGDQLLYLFLIPHLVVFMFLLSFGKWIIAEHKGLRSLLVIVAYIFIIWSGWYGTFIVPIMSAWFALILGSAFLFFALTFIIPPARLQGLMGLAGAAGTGIHEATFGKANKRKAIEGEIKKLMAERMALERRLSRYESEPGMRSSRAINAIKTDISDLDAKIERLKVEESG